MRNENLLAVCHISVGNLGPAVQVIDGVDFLAYDSGNEVSGIANPADVVVSKYSPSAAPAADCMGSGGVPGADLNETSVCVMQYLVDAIPLTGQTGVCAGSITVSDKVAGSPGSVVATGSVTMTQETWVLDGMLSGALYKNAPYVSENLVTSDAIQDLDPSVTWVPGLIQSMNMNLYCTYACQENGLLGEGPCNEECGMINMPGNLDLVATLAPRSDPPDPPPPARGLFAFEGNGDGTFGTPSSQGNWSQYLALGDVDNDGFIDVAFNRLSGWTSQIAINQRNGSLGSPSNISADTTPTNGLAIGYVDNDLNADVVYANNGVNRVYFGNGDGTFTAGEDISADTYNTRDIELADMDNDGDLDIIAANINDENMIYWNTGVRGSYAGMTGTSLGPASDWYSSITIGDFAPPSDCGALAPHPDPQFPDIAMANYSGRGVIYWNTGGGGFVDGSTCPSPDLFGPSDNGFWYPPSIMAADVNNNGTMDLLEAGPMSGALGGAMVHYDINGDDNLAAPATPIGNTVRVSSTGRARDITVGDFNNDGWLDIVTVENDPYDVVLRLNDGTGSYPAAGTVIYKGDARDILAVELNFDLLNVSGSVVDLTTPIPTRTHIHTHGSSRYVGGMVYEMAFGPNSSICSADPDFWNDGGMEAVHQDHIDDSTNIQANNSLAPHERLKCSHRHFDSDLFMAVGHTVNFMINEGIGF